MNRVAITGIGIVDTLGSIADDCFSAMLSDTYKEPQKYIDIFPNNQVKELNDIKAFSVNVREFVLPKIENAVLASLGRSQKYILHAVESAIIDSGVNKEKTNVAVLASNVTSGRDNFIDRMTKMMSGKRIKPTLIMHDGPDFVGGLISEIYKFHGINVCISSACITGLAALDYASRLVDQHDYIVCTTGDCVLNEPDMYNFLLLGAVGKISSPFDDQRNGFIPGEGAGCLILESEEKAKKRNARIYGYIESVSLANDGYHMTSPDPDGLGAKLVMNAVTEEISKADIAFCCAHATSTPIGDVIEYNAISEVLPNIPIVSFKSKIGHTMASSPLIELIYTILSLQKGIVPPNFNLNSCEFDRNNTLIKNPIRINKKYAVKNSFGFGGKCASILIAKE